MLFMTFNLRFENDKDGPLGWTFRRDALVEVIAGHRPLILGTQEGTRNQLSFLCERLGALYEMVAVNRVWDDTCQYPTLFYRKDLLTMMEGGEFWLSRTPAVHRSKNWDSAFPRMMSHALLREGTGGPDGREILAVVTHLDHLGSEARVEQAKIVAAWVNGQSAPCIVMGDFNDAPGSRVHQVLTREHRLMVDSWEALSLPEDEMSMTHHNFLGEPDKFRMDWILCTQDFKVTHAAIVRDNPGCMYPSDHYPYIASLDWA